MPAPRTVVGASDHYARAELVALRAEHAFDALILETSPYERLPDSLAKILASRPITNAADGMLDREALATAAAELGIEVRRWPRKVDAPDVVFTNAPGSFVGPTEITDFLASSPGWGKVSSLSSNCKALPDIHANTTDFAFECIIVDVSDQDPRTCRSRRSRSAARIPTWGSCSI